MARIRRYLRSTPASVAAVLLAGAALAGFTTAHTRPPVRTAGPPACPDTFRTYPSPRTTRYGDLVPTGATAALLCVYPHPDRGDQFGLRDSIPLDPARLGRLTGLLNALAPATGSAGEVCSAAGFVNYQIAIGYPDNTHVVVAVHWNCGTIASTGNVRVGAGLRDILGLWPGQHP